MCLCVLPDVCYVVGLSLSQALDMLLAGDTFCGFSLQMSSSGGTKVVRATQTASHSLAPPPSSPSSAKQLAPCSPFSWAPESGLWPVDECYILAVSTRVSWGLVCGGSAVSGSVCQLLIPLPLAPRRTLQPVTQTHAEL